MVHVRQSRPDSGLGFQVNVVETFQVVPSKAGNAIQVVEEALPPRFDDHSVM